MVLLEKLGESCHALLAPEKVLDLGVACCSSMVLSLLLGRTAVFVKPLCDLWSSKRRQAVLFGTERVVIVIGDGLRFCSGVLILLRFLSRHDGP